MKQLSVIFSAVILLWSCGKKEEKKEQVAIPDTLNVVQVVGLASIEPVQRVLPLTSEVNGLVANIFHNSGEEVKKGEVIAELEHNVETAQVQQAASKIATQRSAIEAQKATKASLQIKLDNARTTTERNQRLLQGNAVTQQVYDDSKTAYESQQQDLATAEANIRQQENKLKELQSDLNYYNSLLERKIVRAPLNGKILNLDLKLGSVVNSNTSFGDFAPEGAYMAVTEIDELFANKVALEQAAYIREQGGTDTITTGKVIFISPYLKKKSLFSDRPDNLEDRRVREVRVELTDKSKVLIGSRLECVINIK